MYLYIYVIFAINSMEDKVFLLVNESVQNYIDNINVILNVNARYFN